jgi:hypothetical protein
VHHGTLWVVKKNKKSTMHTFYLFNDLLLCCTEIDKKFGFNFSIDLLDAVLTDEKDTDSFANGFRLSSKRDSFIIFAESKIEKNQWIQSIIECFEILAEEIDIETEISKKEEDLIVQDWIPDKERETCRACDVEFTLFNRKHHCRAWYELLYCYVIDIQ